jgi:hypothetical protein
MDSSSSLLMYTVITTRTPKALLIHPKPLAAA